MNNFTIPPTRAFGGLILVVMLAGYYAQDVSLARDRVQMVRLQSSVTATLRNEVDAVRLEAEQRCAWVRQAANQADRGADAVRDQLARLRITVDEENADVRAAIMALTERVMPDSRTLSNELLAPTVQLNGLDAVGSGTLVCSRVDPVTGTAENYVLSAWHVVRAALADNPDRVISVTLYGSGDDPVEVPGEVVIKSSELDLVLLRLGTDVIFSHVARMLHSEDAASVAVWDAVYAVGCPLGNAPIPSAGAISSKTNFVKIANKEVRFSSGSERNSRSVPNIKTETNIT